MSEVVLLYHLLESFIDIIDKTLLLYNSYNLLISIIY